MNDETLQASVALFVAKLPAYEPQPVRPHTIEKFFNGQLTPAEIAVMTQNIIDTGMHMSYGPHVLQLALLLVEVGICTTQGRVLH